MHNNNILLFVLNFLEGVKEREKQSIGSVLKSLSYMRDNTYHLHRHIWNDVHEDWPFYTEQDRQSLKRLINYFINQLALFEI